MSLSTPVTSVANFLMRPGVNRFVADLDDVTSMTSILSRDALDVAGRVYSVSRRGRHNTREEAVEQGLTWLVWGFGARSMKALYDNSRQWLFSKGHAKVAYPSLDPTLLDANFRQISKGVQRPNLQRLTPELVEKYFPNLSDEVVQQAGKAGKRFLAYKDHLVHLAGGEKGLLRAYQHSSWIKCGLSTIVPALMIVLGVHPFNQFLTRRILAKEKREAEKRQRVNEASTANRTQSLKKTGMFRIFQNNQHPVTAPASAFAGAAATLFGTLKTGFSSSKKDGRHPEVQFGSLGSSINGFMNRLIRDDRMNTLWGIDVPLSSGRFLVERNLSVRLETAYQEGMLILFMFFAQTPIQNWFAGKIDKWFNVNTGMEFKAFRKLLEEYKDRQGGLIEAFEQIKRELGEDFKSFGPLSNRKIRKSPEIQELLHNFEDRLLNRSNIRDYAANGQKGHLLFDLAKECGYIPMKTITKDVDVFDITQRIETDKIYKLGQQVEQVLGLAKKQQSIEAFLKKSMVGRLGAFLAATAVCTAVIGWIVPRTKQYITYYLTGQDQFPGTMYGGERQGLFSTKTAYR